MSRMVSRRGLIGGAFAVAAALAGRLVKRARAEGELGESEKIPHADALYQSVPKGQQRCEICLQFEPPNHCKIVQGPIFARGWCQYFAARENAQ